MASGGRVELTIARLRFYLPIYELFVVKPTLPLTFGSQYAAHASMSFRRLSSASLRR